MLPDPDWKVEDQRGARARKCVGDNNDNDNQGGDILVGCSKRRSTEKLRKMTTKKESPPVQKE